MSFNSLSSKSNSRNNSVTSQKILSTLSPNKKYSTSKSESRVDLKSVSTSSSFNTLARTRKQKNTFSWLLWAIWWAVTRFIAAIIAVLLAIISPIVAVFSSLYSLYMIFRHREEFEDSMRAMWPMALLLDFINAAAIATALTELSLTIAKNMEMIRSVQGFLNQTKTALDTIGNHFIAYVPLILAFSMFYDLLENVNHLIKLHIEFALDEVKMGLLITANLATGLAIGTDIAFNIIGLVAKNGQFLLHYVPILSFAIQGMNIAIDIIQTLLLINKQYQALITLMSRIEQLHEDISKNTCHSDSEYINSKAINSENNFILIAAITDQYYILTLRTAAKVLVLAACIIATILNPILGALVTIGAVLISQGLKQESKNTQLEIVQHKSSVFYRLPRVRQTMYKAISKKFFDNENENSDFAHYRTTSL